MDGVPDLTQSPIEPGDSFDYAFVAPDAGTYWYHSHNRSWEQMARGLHGVLIVEEKEPPQVDQDLLLVLDDWRLREDGEIDAESFGHMMDLSHGGRLGNILAFNGSAKASEFSVRSGERVRLRICNVANARIFEVRLDGHQPWVVALDGQPTTPFEPDKRGITVAPAQRVDLIFDLVCGKRRPFRQGARMTEQRKRRIAVLGASGSVGRRIVVRLLERGFEVLCQTRTAEKLSHVADRVEVQAF